MDINLKKTVLGQIQYDRNTNNPVLFSEQTTLNKIRAGLTYFAILSLLKTGDLNIRTLCDKLASYNLGPYTTGQLGSYLLKIEENGYIARYKEKYHVFYRLLEPGYAFLAKKTQEIQQMIQGIGR